MCASTLLLRGKIMQQDLFQNELSCFCCHKNNKIKVLLFFQILEEMTAQTLQSATLMSKVFFAHSDRFLEMILNRFERNYDI